MSNGTQTEMNYQNSIRTAERIEEIAEKLRTNGKNRYSEVISTIPYCWEGGSVNDFVKKADAVSKDIQRSIEFLYRIAGIIRTAADNRKEAEENSVALAAARIGQGL